MHIVAGLQLVNLTFNLATCVTMWSKLTDLCVAGMLFAQKPAAPGVSQTVTAAGTSGFSALSSSHSPTSSSSTSSKGPN